MPLPRMLFVAALGMTTGCYTYVPVERPLPRAEVRAVVPITSAVTRQGRQPETFDVEGRVVSSGDTLVLATTTRAEFGAYREATRTDTVRMATTDLLRVEQRTFSRPRTLVLTGLVVGGVGGVVAGIISVRTGSQGGGNGNGGSTTSQFVSPRFTLNLARLFGG